MSKNFRATLNRRLETDTEFRREYEALAPEYELAKMLFACRNANNLTQKQLSELTGIDQADISKIENGNANPSIKTLTRIASAMNMNVKIEFVPKSQKVWFLYIYDSDEHREQEEKWNLRGIRTEKKQIIIYPAMWNEPQKSNTIFISDAYLKYARPYAVQKIKDEL